MFIIIVVPLTDYVRHDLQGWIECISFTHRKPLAEPCHAKTGLNTIGNVVHTAIRTLSISVQQHYLYTVKIENFRQTLMPSLRGVPIFSRSVLAWHGSYYNQSKGTESQCEYTGNIIIMYNVLFHKWPQSIMATHLRNVSNIQRESHFPWKCRTIW